MPVGAVNNNQQRTYAVTGALAGLGAGAIAGGTYGYLSKPWLKDGNLTDTFIKEADNALLNIHKKDNKQIVEDLKKMQETGSVDHVSQAFKDTFNDVSFTTMSTEERKAFPKTLLDTHEAKDLDEVLKSLNEIYENASLKGLTEKRKRVLKNLTNDMSVEDLQRFLKEEDYAIEGISITKENKKQVIETLRTAVDESVSTYKELTKEGISGMFNSDKKSLKDLPANADYRMKSSFDAVKKAMSNIKLKAGAKWGAIGAGALGTIGLAVGALNNKK